MARPHLEFIQAQTLPWHSLGAGEVRPGAECKTLSADPESGAASVILRYPARWRMDRPHHVTCDEEFYLLSGDLAVGGVTYGAGDYAYLPAGMPRPEMASERGAVVLTFFEGHPRSATGDAPDDLYDPTRLVACVRTVDMAWEPPSDPVVAAMMQGVGRKSLRRDPNTGEHTWILVTGADDPAKLTEARVETHPVVEEMFLIDGEITLNTGTIRRGGYFWRPPEIPHGPFGTRAGLLGFFRSKGGPLTSVWSEKAQRIDWDPPYRPVLPPDLRDYAGQNYDPSLAF